MPKTKCSLIVAVALSALSLHASDVRTEEIPNPDIVAEAYEDGNVLLVLGRANLKSLPDLRMLDLSEASPERTVELVQEFLDGKHDGVFLGVPSRGTGSTSSPGDCRSLVYHAELIKRICTAAGSKATEVVKTESGGGTCENGLTIALRCHEETR